MNKFNPTDKPAFCIIAPTAYLDAYSGMSGTHLVLAHLVDTDVAYCNYYAQRSKAGDRIIMDNGAFELGQSYDPSKLIDLGKACGAHMLVLPDYPDASMEKTKAAAEKYAPVFRSCSFQTMYVPHAEIGNWDDWISSYIWAKYNPQIDAIGMSILNIPNALPHIDPAFVRVVATAMLGDHFAKNKYHHYLGLNAGPALEIPSLLRMGVLNSCDSSGPVWAGICGHEYSQSCDSYQAVKKIKKHVDFAYPMTKDQATKTRIFNNIILTLGLFK